jgi:hypothetical protein
MRAKRCAELRAPAEGTPTARSCTGAGPGGQLTSHTNVNRPIAPCTGRSIGQLASHTNVNRPIGRRRDRDRAVGAAEHRGSAEHRGAAGGVAPR